MNVIANTIDGICEAPSAVDFIASIDYSGPIYVNEEFIAALKDAKEGEEIRGFLEGEFIEQADAEYGINRL